MVGLGAGDDEPREACVDVLEPFLEPGLVRVRVRDRVRDRVRARVGARARVRVRVRVSRPSRPARSSAVAGSATI